MTFRVSEVEEASCRRMGAVQETIQHALKELGARMPELTRVELVTALLEVAQRQLLHQWRAEISEEEGSA